MGHDTTWPDSGTTLLVAALVAWASYVGSFKASNLISPLLSSSYTRLGPQKQLEWDSRWASTLHALVITSAAGYMFLATDTFSDAKDDATPAILRLNSVSSAALGYSLGYFSTDLVMLCLHYPHFGGPEMGVHHFAAWASIVVSGFGEEGQMYTLALLSTECTTPFVNARWMLEAAGMRNSRRYLVNGLALVADWFLGRIVLFLVFFTHVYRHTEQIALLSKPAAFLLTIVPVLLFFLNIMWFYKILRGARKLLRGYKADKAMDLGEEVDSTLLIPSVSGLGKHANNKDL